MLRKVRLRNHVMVGLAVVLMSLLAGCRVIGAGDDALIRPERFDAKQVTVWPEGDNGVHVREIVDIDFGPTERHGYQRIIPNDFGEPESVEATSDVNADVAVVNVGNDTRIRIGDPNETLTGRHRYTLDYVLPDAQLDSGVLALDIVGNEETMETKRFEVVVTGFEFDTTACDTGAFGVFGGCDLVKDDTGQLRRRHRAAGARRPDHGRRHDHRVRRTVAASDPRSAGTGPERLQPARPPDDPGRRDRRRAGVPLEPPPREQRGRRGRGRGRRRVRRASRPRRERRHTGECTDPSSHRRPTRRRWRRSSSPRRAVWNRGWAGRCCASSSTRTPSSPGSPR